jgi:hypothetical protein
MIKKDDIIRGMKIILKNEITLFNKKSHKDVTFSSGTIFTVNYLSKDRYNPMLTLSDGMYSYRCFNLEFEQLCEQFDFHSAPSEHHLQLHQKKLKQVGILKKVKKLALNDDLLQIKELIDKEYLKSLKCVKRLMMYAIQSKDIKILNYGFKNNWFKKINFNENVSVAPTFATPLYYAILKDFKKAQYCLIENGASVSNKTQAHNQYTIQELIEDIDDIEDFEKVDQKVIHHLIAFEDTVKEKNHLESLAHNHSNKTKKLKI